MKRKLMNNYPYCIALVIFWILVLVITRPFAEENQYNEMEVVNIKSNTGLTKEIDGGDILEQSFRATEDDLEAVAIGVVTYAREIASSFEISVMDERQRIIYQQTIEGTSIADNQLLKIEFEEQEDSKGKIYYVKVKNISGTAGNSISLWTADTQGNETGEFIQNGEKMDETLVFHTYYKKSYLLVQIIMWMILIILSFVVVLNLERSDEKQFLKLSLVLGSLLLIYNPFTHPLDEPTHFFRSFCISQGDIHDEVINGDIGAYVSDNFEEIIDSRLSIVTFLNNPEVWLQKFSTEETYYIKPYMASVVPINHGIAAVGIAIGRLLGMNILMIILLGRVATFAFYVFVCYHAIKNVRHYKTFMFVVASMPISLWLAASYSADPILVACTLMFLSICFKYRFDWEEERNQQITIKDIIILALCALSIASVKYCIYVLVMLLFFIIPQKCFKSKKQYWASVALLGGAVMIVFIWQIYLLGAFPFEEDRNGYVNMKEQIKFVFSHIIYSIQNFSDYIVNSLLGHMQGLGFQDAVPAITQGMGVVTIAGAFLAEDKYEINDRKVKKWSAIGLLSLVTVTYLLIVAALYAGYTPVGKYGVDGVQTRYWLPLLLPVMLLISYIPVKNEIKNYEKKVSFIMIAGTLNIIAGALLDVF